MRKAISAVLIMILTVISLTSCGKAGDSMASSVPGNSNAVRDPEESGQKKDDLPKQDKSESDAYRVEGDSEDDVPEKKSLAKRLCGKYSFHTSSGDLAEDEYYTMDVISFGDNLYALCGQAMADDSDQYDCYSFWAAEFIPDKSEALKAEGEDRAAVTALSFSVMSNLGKYWDSGAKGTITLDDKGLLFEGFDNSGFLVPENDSGRLFLRDERVEDTFVYLKAPEKSGDDSLQGYWMMEGEEAPVYLCFENSNLYIYQKSPEKEVCFMAGGCEFEEDSFSCRASMLGTGDMPYEIKGSFEVTGEKLTIAMEGDYLPEELTEKAVFRKAGEDDIHVTTMDEVIFSGDSFGYFGMGDGWYEHLYEDGFYGVWTSAVKERDIAVSEAKKLNGLGYESYVCYSPEWEELNSDGYYCVAAGRFTSETEARDALDGVKNAGFKDAYVKFSGKRKYTTVSYYNYGSIETEVYSGKVILKNVPYDISRSWYPQINDSDEQNKADLIIDEDTVFDESCDMQFFGNYENGDTPLAWFQRNCEYKETDPDKYIPEGPALSGVFEAGLRGNHIDRFFGSYWWD